MVVENIDPAQVQGNIALLANFPEAENSKDAPSVAFSDWRISGEKVVENAEQHFGPVCFAQYTLHRNVLKLTAQLAPIEAVEGHQISLQVFEGRTWKTIKNASIDPLGRSAHFRVEGWTKKQAVPYRVLVTLPLKGERREYDYGGTIASAPEKTDQLKMAMLIPP